MDRPYGGCQSPVTSAAHAWRTEDAGHGDFREYRLAYSAPATLVAQSELEELSSQTPESNGLDRFLHRAQAHPESVVCVHRTGASASPGACISMSPNIRRQPGPRSRSWRLS